MDLVLWLLPGAAAGAIAAKWLPARGHTVLGDTGVGMIGALFGGWLLVAVGMQPPFAGWPGRSLLSLFGAVALLLLTRVVHLSGRRRFV